VTEISKKKILFVSSVSDFYKFILNNMKICLDLGMDVSYACNLNTRAGEELKQVCTDLGIHLYHVEFARSPYSKQNIKAYKQLKELIEKENFDILDTHTPMASVISRWICKKRDMKIMYTAHGFHFFKGAPLKNWVLYYPIEKYLSKYTDILITINKEDYQRAKDNFKMKQLEYILGVGIDVEYFKNMQVDIEKKRHELGVSENQKILLSIGELNNNKNHRIVIEAMHKLNNSNIVYMIAGIGSKKEELQALATKYELSENLKLLGYRKDVAELYKIADVFVFPSKREGLSVSLMEAISSGIPCVVSDIRGNHDLIEDNINGYTFKVRKECNIDSLAKCIKNILNNKDIRNKFRTKNVEKSNEFSRAIIGQKMIEIYQHL
jgi:glycosyltransferase involved in cell wall biosynthesis